MRLGFLTGVARLAGRSPRRKLPALCARAKARAGTTMAGLLAAASLMLAAPDAHAQNQVISISVSPTSVTENGGAKTINVTVNRFNITTYPITATISVGGGSATSGTDYAAVTNFDISIAEHAAYSSGSFTLTPTDDSLIEGNETITVTATASGGRSETATITLTDNDYYPAVTLSAAPSSVSEGASGTSVTVTATSASSITSARTVTVSVGGSGTATSGTDYAAVSDFDITIAANATSGTGTFTLTPTEDTLVEGSETIGVSGTSPSTQVTGTTVTLTDNDLPAVSLSVSPSEVDEDDGATSVTVTATATAAHTAARTVTVSVGGSGTATSGTDYAAVSNFDITIAADATSGTGTFTLTPTDDSTVEGDETVGVAGTTSLATVTGTTVTLDDDDTYSVALSVNPSEVDEDASATSVTVTATATAISSARTVQVSVSGGTATWNTDYAAVGNFNITIAANATTGTGTFTLTPTDDAIVEHDETITVWGQGTSLTVTDANVTLDDDDSGTVTIADASASEGDSISFTLTLDRAVQGGATLTPSFSDGTATEGTDYDETEEKINFTGTAGETQTLTVTTTEDNDYESDETFTVSLSVSDSPSALTATDTATGTITNDDLPAVTLSANPSSVGEGAGATSVTVTATAASAHTSARTVTVSVGGSGTATSGTDYAAVSNFDITIAADATSATGTFTLTPTDDSVPEGGETIGVAGTTSQATVTATTVTLTDNDSAEVTIANASASEGNSVSFTVTLDTGVPGGLTVTPSFTDGTATEGTDYTENTAGLTFAGTANETQTFTVATTQDTDVEPDETFTVSLTVSDTSASVTATDTATGTITNDDGSATVTIADASASEGDSISFTVTLDKSVPGGLTVTPSFSGGTATKGTDYTENTADLTFSGTANETQTFTVATIEDKAVEADETFTVSLAVSDTSASVTATDTATGTITNDDLPAVTLSAAPSSVSEGASGTSVTVTATAASAIASSREVTVSVGDSGTATSVTDYAAVSDFTITIAANATSGTGTFTLTPTQDTLVEGDETIGVDATISNSTVTAATVTITDDDSAPSVNLSLSSSSVSEGASGTSVTVTAAFSNSNTYAGDKTVTVSVGGGGTATSGTDYATVSNFDITISKGNTSGTGTFTLTPTDDSVHEGSETIGVSGSSTGLTVNSATLTLTDNDTAAVTVNDASAGEGSSMTFTVTLDTAVQGGLTVTPDFTDVTATEGTDYDENTTALSFTGNANETKTFTVSTTQDAVVEGNETFTVGLTVSNAPSGVTDTDTGTGTIESGTGADQDTATLTINDASASEGDGMTFTVTLSEAVQGGLTVTPSYANGTTASGDYTANTTALTFSGTKGETETFTVSTTEDAVLEANETFTVSLTVSGTTLGSSITSTDTGTGTIDNDDSSTVTVNDANASEGNSMTFTVTLSEAVQGGLKVTPDFTDGTATEGTDYDENTTALSFSGTKGETKTFTVSTDEDAVLEANETFTVGLSISGTSLSLTVSDTGTGTINNDDSAAVTVNDANADEGNDITFTVTLGAAVQGGLKATPDFTDGTAVEGTDYDENTAALSFTGTANETKTFTVSTTEDAVVEGNETFTVGLTVSGTSLGVTDSDTGTGTINNDDGAVVTVDNANASEGDDIAFTVTLGAAVQGGLTVTPSFTDATAVEGTDYDENTAALSFTGTKGETRTFAVSTTEDAVVEGDETFTVGLGTSNSSVTSTDTGTGTIDNDDSAAVTVNDASADEGDGMTFTVTLDKAVQGGLKVTPGYTNGTASSSDYTKNTAALSFGGTVNETKTFTVSTTEDNLFEGGETFTVGLSASNSSVASTDTGTGTIDNDDPQPSVNLSASPSRLTEDAGATTVTVTATLSNSSRFPDDRTVTVSVGSSGDTATSGTDYAAAANFDLEIAKTEGSGAATFTLTPTQDSLVEGDETVGVAGTSTGLAVDGTTLTLSDDAGDKATVTIDNAQADEGESMTFSVTVDRAVPGGFTVTPRYTDATAGGDDYTQNTAALRFSGTFRETRTFTVSTIQDTRAEGDETFRVDLTVSGTTHRVGAGNTGTGIIIDDDNDSDDGAALTIGDASASEGDGLTFTVTVNNAVPGGFTATPAYTDGGAVAGVDYTPETSALSFTGAANERHSFTVSSIEDAEVEPDETFLVGLTVSGTTHTVSAGDTGTGTIVDDDSAAGDGAALTISGASASEGDGLTFTVTVDNAVPGGFTVTPAYSDGTAVAGVDYTPETSALSFTGAANERHSFTVSSIEDAEVEPDETFLVGLTVSGTTHTVGVGDPGTGTIIDDDSDAALTIGGASASEGDGLTFTVTVNNAVPGGFTVTPAYTDGTAVAGVDYTPETSALSFTGAANERHSFTVSSIEDTEVEPDETFSVDLTVTPGGDTGAKRARRQIASASATGTITNDDAYKIVIEARIVLSADPDSIGEDADPVTVELKAMADGAISSARTVTVSVGDASDGATEGTDYAAVDDFDLVIAANATEGATTFTLAPENDDLVEGDETITVSGSGEDLDVASTTITLTDDDHATLTIDDASADEGDAMTFTVTLDRAVPGGLTVTPDYTDGTATGADYAKKTDALSFAGTDNETKTFTVPTTEDTDAEGDETFTVALSLSGTAHRVEADDTATGTIVDDDTHVAADRAMRIHEPVLADMSLAMTESVVDAVSGRVARASGPSRRFDYAGGGGYGTPGAAGLTLVRVAGPPSLGGPGWSAHTSVGAPSPYGGHDATLQVGAPTWSPHGPGMLQAGVAGGMMPMGGPGVTLNAGPGMASGGYGTDDPHRRSMRQRLGGLSFEYSLRKPNDDGAELGTTIWGQSDLRTLGGNHDYAAPGESVAWDGDVLGLVVGADRLLRPGLLAGVAVSRFDSAMDYDARGSDGESEGVYETSMTGVHPYTSWTATPKLDLWAAGGFGTGGMLFDEKGLGIQKADSGWLTGAAGGKLLLATLKGLVPGGTTRLNLKADALATRLEVRDNGALVPALGVNANRLRLAMVGEHTRVLASGAVFTPALEIGARRDGGAGETGTGLEVGGKLSYESVGGRLSVEMRAHTLAAFGMDKREWGVGGTVRLAPGPEGRGFSFSLRPSYGADGSGAEGMWRQRPVRNLAAPLATRLESEFGYGLPVRGGLLTLLSGVSWREQGSMRRTAGALLERRALGLRLDLEQTATPEGPGYGATLRLEKVLGAGP